MPSQRYSNGPSNGAAIIDGLDGDNPNKGVSGTINEWLAASGLASGDVTVAAVPTVLSAGAAGDGTTADQSSFEAASPAMIVPTGTYRIADDATVTSQLTVQKGATIAVDSGVTLTLALPPIAGDYSIFSGAGTVKIKAGEINAAWFAGSTLNAKWDFLRRGLTTNDNYSVYVPTPAADDPAACDALVGGAAWLLDAPLKFGDPENQAHIRMPCWLAPASGYAGTAILFSETIKTEDITFEISPKVTYNGSDRFSVGVDIKGGARLHFLSILDFHSVDLPIRLRTDVSSVIGCDDIFFSAVHADSYRNRVIDIDGNLAGIREVKCPNIAINGCESGHVAPNVLRITGIVRNIDIGTISLNVTSGLVDISGEVVRIEANSTGSPQYGLSIGKIYTVNSTAKGIVTANNGGSAKVQNLRVGCIVTPAAVAAELAYCKDILIECVQTESESITIKADAEKTTIANCIMSAITIEAGAQYTWLDRTRVTTLTDAGIYTFIDGTLKKQVLMADDSAISLDLPPEYRHGCKVYFSVADSSADCCGLFVARPEGQPSNAGIYSLARSAGSLVQIIDLGSTDTFTGTSGTDGRVSVGANATQVWLENRMGAARYGMIEVVG